MSKYSAVRLSLLGIAVAMVIAGCSSAPRRSSPASTPATPPKDVAAIPDAVPQAEPRSKRGNPPFYEVFGKRYFVMDSAAGYVERGIASWYGPGFHAASTSNGERYDMYGMTAAHKTLPLPTYVQVTNLSNGRSVVVRVNDRGPFKDGRIIDLSYTAAAKLDLLRAGTAQVEVRALAPGQTSPAATAVASTQPVDAQPVVTATPAGAAASQAADAGAANEMFIQAGSFGSESNATKLASQLRAQGVNNSFVRQDTVNGQVRYRVRVGPMPSVAEFDRVLARLKALGIGDARLASD